MSFKFKTKPNTLTKICKICGAEYQTTVRTSKYCASCRDSGEAANRRKEYMKAWREAHPDYAKKPLDGSRKQWLKSF